MFCPQCGNEIASDRVRFCTRCRFPLGSMKEFIVTEVEKPETEERMMSHPLRQVDINIGAGFILIGAIKAFFIAFAASDTIWPGGIAIFMLLLGFMLSAFLLFAQLSPRQRGLTVGATLMFLGAALSMLAGVAIPGAGIITVAPIFLLIIPFWMKMMKMMRVFLRFFFDKDVKPEKAVYVPTQPAIKPVDVSTSALPPVQNTPAVEIDTNRMKKEETVAPFSITENTTEMLKNKQLVNPQ